MWTLIHKAKNIYSLPFYRGSSLPTGWSLFLLLSRLVISDSLRPYGLLPAGCLCPWNSPSKNTGAGCHSLLRGPPWPRGQTLVSCIDVDSHTAEGPGKPLVETRDLQNRVHSCRAEERKLSVMVIFLIINQGNNQISKEEWPVAPPPSFSGCQHTVK